MHFKGIICFSWSPRLISLTKHIFSDERCVLWFGRGGWGQAFAVGHETSAASGRQRQPLVRLPQPKLISGWTHPKGTRSLGFCTTVQQLRLDFVSYWISSNHGGLESWDQSRSRSRSSFMSRLTFENRWEYPSCQDQLFFSRSRFLKLKFFGWD